MHGGLLLLHSPSQESIALYSMIEQCYPVIGTFSKVLTREEYECRDDQISSFSNSRSGNQLFNRAWKDVRRDGHSILAGANALRFWELMRGKSNDFLIQI